MKIIKLLPLFLVIIFLSSCSNLDVQLLNQKAMEYMKQGDVDSAIARLESINDLNPNFPETNYNLGIAYHKKQEYKKALASLDKATSLKPDFAQAYYTKGVIYEEIALNIIELQKTQDHKANKDKIAISESLVNSKENFEKYLKYSPKAQDASDVNAKIEQLKNDIQHYSPESNISGNN
jgi:tetratricopeptide (TPR) repeat protein